MIDIQMNIQTIEWRREKKIDSILETYSRPEVYQKYFSMGRCGTDKFGCPRKIYFIAKNQ